MALSFRRETAEIAPEALVFSGNFSAADALIEDLDTQFGEDQWLEVPLGDAENMLSIASSDDSFVIVALSSDDDESVEQSAQLIRQAREYGLSVLLIVGDISPRTMHRIMREGVAEFAPYPEPAGALIDAIDRLRLARSSGNLPAVTTTGAPRRLGKVVAFYGVAGGVGASTFAVNFAWEMTLRTRREGRRVALLDFNFQYGSIATFLDVPRREAVYELVSEASNLDQTGLTQALSTYKDKLHVLTAPRDALPLDIVSPSDVDAIIGLARESFDYVVIDMPQALMNWSEKVYAAADDFYAVMEVDMRSAQNMYRFLRTLKAEDMNLDKLRFVLNRAPGLTDLSGKTRVKRVAESLGIAFLHQVPDGGRPVVNCGDQGTPLAEGARSNPVRKEILRMVDKFMAEDSEKTAASG
ncbi:MAG: AAA family ATPase [Proteobacteria bacterium]|nr:AAA family ATPase [Pseudomonadota bacterium]